jgi:hypothetical protein
LGTARRRPGFSIARCLNPKRHIRHPSLICLLGDVLVLTPKRIGRDFEKGRPFATIERGQWIDTARAAFDEVVVALYRPPRLESCSATRR